MYIYLDMKCTNIHIRGQRHTTGVSFRAFWKARTSWLAQFQITFEKFNSAFAIHSFAYENFSLRFLNSWFPLFSDVFKYLTTSSPTNHSTNQVINS